MERLIYALKCPVTGSIHYVGKSTTGMRRPKQHMLQSHSEKISEWVNNLKEFGTAPVITVLEEVRDGDDIDNRERYWIQYILNEGGVLLNEMLVTPLTINPNLDAVLNGPADSFKKISRFIRARRHSVGLTQEEFALKAGVGLRLLREIEQEHRTNFNLDGLFKILSMFGCTLDVVRILREES